MIDWMTIESAPKDGTEILMSDGKYVCMVFWNVKNGTWDDGDFYDHLDELDYWAPINLPNPETVKAQQEVRDTFNIPIDEINLAVELIVDDRGLNTWENHLPTLFGVWRRE